MNGCFDRSDRCSLRRQVHHISLVIVLIFTIAMGAHGHDIEVDFNIEAQPVDSALLKFAQQARMPVLFPSGQFANLTANQLVGRFQVETALIILLEGTGIEASIEGDTGQLVVRAAESVQEPKTQEEKIMASMQPQSTRRVLASAISALFAGAAAGSVSAQAPQGDPVPQVEEISVTGSRIRVTSGMSTPTPVTALTLDELQSFEPASTVAEQLDALPQFFQTQTAQRGGGTLFGDASGSYLNLRGMGKQRTLVLFDGSRVVPADRASSVNVDNFPTALIRSVDVVTGGASAAYGADALAGVVNFVLDREFEGLKISTGSGVTEFGDGANWNFSVAGGKKFGDRLNVIASMDARKINEIYRQPHDMRNFQSWGFVTNPAWSPTAGPGIPRQITLPNVHSTVYTPAGLIDRPGFSLNRHTFTGDGLGVRPFIRSPISNIGGPGATNTQSGGLEGQVAERAFDGGPSGNAVDQFSSFAAVKYDFTDSFSVFGQVMNGRTVSESTGRRGNPHLQTNTWAGTVFVDNAYLPDNVRQAMINEGVTSFRFHKLGQLRGPGISNYYDDRRNEDISQMLSGTIGFDLSFSNGWDLRGSYQRGTSKVISSAYNIQRTDRFFLAMDAVRHPVTGAIVCNVTVRNPSKAELAAAMQGVPVSTTTPPLTTFVDSPVGPGSIENCVPLNVFGHGNASQEAIDYLVDDKYARRRLGQHFAEMLLTGELFDGFGAGPVSFASGLTYRKENFYQFAFEAGQDFPFERGMVNVPALGIRGIPNGFAGGGALELNQFSGTGQATGGFDVWEVFGELNMPIWESASGSQRLGSNLAYRSSDYSLSGRVASWKAGIDFTLSDELRLRATKSRDVREPSLAEQFEIGGGGGSVNDPFFQGAFFAITSLNASNPNLRPEIADTVTAGFIYQPTFASWVEGMQVSVDWYQIDVSGAVGQLGPQRIVDGCFFDNTPQLCELVFRNASTGIIDRVMNQRLNIASAKTSGVDLEMQYRFETNFFQGQQESWNIRALAGYLMENSDTPFQGTKRDAVGGLNRPEWTAVLTANYQVGPWGMRLQQRFYDRTKINVLWVEGVDVDDNWTASQSITNLGFSYGGDMTGGGNWRATLNINNLFDRDPPVLPSISQRGGFQSVSNNFDVFGRRYQLNLNVNF
jgi:iron complex outermembrane recepter protein